MEPDQFTSSVPIRVAIIGAGIGGLVLAQLLRNDKRFDVTVYERGSREGEGNSLTGFRILVLPEIFESMREKMEPEVRELLGKAVGASKSSGNRVCLMDQACSVKFRNDTVDSLSAYSVSRWKLRNALLYGPRDFVKFNNSFRSYEQGENTITAYFADGETIECDLLVGADGAGSQVRKQLLPKSTRSDSGVTIIYFKAPFTPETEAMIPWESGGMVLTPRQSMVISYFKNPEKPYGPYNLETINPDDSFLMIGLGCYSNEFQHQSKHPDKMTPEELKDECLARAREWHPLLRSLIAITVPSSVFISYLKTQDPIRPWQSGRVTMLGDAAHSMTPYLGRGATSAISDAMALAETLQSEDHALVTRLAEYEISMLQRGFAAAKSSMFVHNLVFMAGNSQWLARLRNLVLRLADWCLAHPNQSPDPFPGLTSVRM
ncbi:Monooxygenase, FAD-binding [Penicillium digitatum]|uniref:Monooxygenase, FAD-binding n=1 Tax=Penicillium digitatum TaxID=36651 RepID=A0A7T6XQD2_PENDI|nr:Monooxygenase, FAD-binding [Penicillium digitatum]